LNNKYESVKDLIAAPKWTTIHGKEYTAAKMVPDIVSITNNAFIISDAKYYSIKLNEHVLSENPGVEDITKQYLYQLAFEEYIGGKGFDLVKNLLLFPSEDEEIKQLGIVTIKFLKELNLEDIALFELPAYKIFELYTNSKKLSVAKFLELKIEAVQ
jgi:5-methylcytosine-specific restriction endonuclease McrBC regulatory subunit McrC